MKYQIQKASQMVIIRNNSSSNKSNNDSIFNDETHHTKTLSPNFQHVVEFKTDSDQQIYLLMELDSNSFVLFESKTKLIKHFRFDIEKEWVHNLFKDIKSLSFTFIKLKFEKIFIRKQFNSEDISMDSEII